MSTFEERQDRLVQNLIQFEQLNQTIQIRITQDELLRLQQEQLDEQVRLADLAEENLLLTKLPKAQKSERALPDKNEPVYRGKSIRYWIRLLADSDLDVAWSGIKALEKIGSPAIPYIVETSLAGNETVLDHVSGMWDTFFFTNPSAAAVALPHFVSAIKHTNPSLRFWAVKGLLGIGAPAAPALPLIANALNDPDRLTRSYAVHALGRVGRNAAVPKLTSLLSHETLRTNAVLALEHLESAASDAVPALLQYLNHADEGFRKSVEDALKAIDPEALARSQQVPFWRQVGRLFGGS